MPPRAFCESVAVRGRARGGLVRRGVRASDLVRLARDPEGEHGAVRLLVGDLDVAAVPPGRLLDDRQAETRTGQRPRRLRSIEALEDHREVSLVDPGTL